MGFEIVENSKENIFVGNMTASFIDFSSYIYPKIS